MNDSTIDHLLQAIPEESSYRTNSIPLSSSQDSIASLDATNFYSISLDDTPILPAIDGKKVKTFEELVEEALKRDDSPANLDDSSKPKKPFLRKGSGLARFVPKPDTPKRERRHCCSKKLEQQFLHEAEKCNQKSTRHYPRKIESSRASGNGRNETNPIKKVITKPQVTKRSRSTSVDIENELNGFSVQPKKVQPVAQNKRPSSGKSLSNMILSQYSSDFEPIQRDLTNHVISHEFSSKENHSKRSNKTTNKEKKVNFEKEDPKVEALERLLKNIRLKQHKLQQLQDLQSDEDSWEDDYEEPEVPRRESHKIKVLPKTKTTKKVTRTGTFTLGKTSLTKDIESNPLSNPRASNYTLSLKRKIETLEDRLRQLTVKCQQNIADYKSRETPDEDKFSPEKIFSEMTEIKKHLSSLSSKLETIETKLLTKESTQGIKINLPSSSSKVLASPETSLYSQIQQLQTGTHLTLGNGDQIMKTSDNTIIYSYSTGIRQITYSDGTRVVEFPSGQIERVGTNGTKTIFYPNGTQRVIRADGSEETITPDGTIIRISVDGTEIIELSNGEREIRTQEFKRREYLDGTIKTIHSDGTEETRFPNGRLRIKDKDGKLIADSLITQFRGVT